MASTHAHHWRLASRLLAALAVVLLMLWPVTVWRPASLARGGGAVGAGAGWNVLAWSNAPIAITSWESNSLPLWSFVGTGASMLDAPPDSWRPCLSTASLSNGAAVLALHTLWIPAWWPPVIVGMLAGVAWWRASKAPGPGHCPRCGYDLTGLTPGAPCPECGPRNATHAPGATLAAPEPRP